MKKSDFKLKYNLTNLNEQRKKSATKWMWIVLVGCFLLQMFPYCVALNLTNVFVGSDWGYWTGGDNTVIGLTFTVGCLSAAFTGPFIAKLFSKNYNPKILYSIGVVVGIIGFMGSSLNGIIIKATGQTRLPLAAAAAILWISNIVSQAGVMLFSGLGINNLISKWWPEERRGFALGLAFTGGSVGNIWMQQLVQLFSKEFGNIPWQQGYIPGNQFATYLIMGAIGMVGGLLVVMFVCKKPLPTTSIFGTLEKDAKAEKVECVNCASCYEPKVSQSQLLAVSPLVTKKYPLYFVLAFGYLVLQMGTIHASMNGLMIGNATALTIGDPQNPIYKAGPNYTEIMGTGGTIFGICCLIGNFGGGVLNDKIGPNKSILMAGILQCVAIFMLMYSVKIPELAYAYFAIAGLSVYVYTSTPAYISGRLYGASQSNNHMALLGIFIAVGFAISNTVSGFITGSSQVAVVNDVPQFTNYMFGKPTAGNIQGLGIFAIACMGVGTLIVSFCVHMTMKRGIKGLLEYSPTKYSWIILFKHSLMLKINTLRIFFGKTDFRYTEEYKEKHQPRPVDAAKVAALKEVNAEKTQAKTEKNINKMNKKNEKINVKIQTTTEKGIDQSKQDKINAKAEAKIQKANAKHEAFIQKASSKDLNNPKVQWKLFAKEYEIIEKQGHAEGMKTLLADKFNEKIAGLNKKIQINQYIANYNNQKLVEGQQLLDDYNSSPDNHIDALLTKRVNDMIETNIEKLKKASYIKEQKFLKQKMIKSKIEASRHPEGMVCNQTIVEAQQEEVVEVKKAEAPKQEKKETKPVVSKQSKASSTKIPEDQKHTTVSKNDYLDSTKYNYDARRKDWHKKAGHNNVQQVCAFCKDDDNWETILLDSNEHVCYYCWIKKDNLKKINGSKKKSK